MGRLLGYGRVSTGDQDLALQVDALRGADRQGKPVHRRGERSPGRPAESLRAVGAPEGNDGAERFIGTLKENLLWVRTFTSVEELRQALLAFRDVYNTTWLIERHRFMSLSAIRAETLSLAALAA